MNRSVFAFSVVGVAALGLITGCEESHSASVEKRDTGLKPPALPEKVTFNAHIRPIFSDTCFACHGFDAKKREADLRLDTPEGAYAKLKDSELHAIVPGKPNESAILAHIFSDDPDEVMPPPKFHKVLTERQKLLVRRWVEQGAQYEKHWAFSPITKPAPATSASSPIDHFILAKLENEGIEPAPVANKATLLRRLSLDLTGLPPSLAELDAFLADDSPDAYAKQVERLLASPHYGERMAVSWLDVARFADTVGYHGDQTARIFPYRDYVIRSFNDNKRFDQFTREQLAGDLLPNPTEEQRIATGFLRLNLMTREGGAQAAEYMAKYMGDRVRALGGAWLGLTTGCAECHDHKFDPITAKDYYSLGAFFADIRQWGVYSHYGNQPNPDFTGRGNNGPFPPEIRSRNAALEQRIRMLQQQMVDVLAPLKKPEHEAALQLWTTQAAEFLTANPDGWSVLKPTDAAVSAGNESSIREDASVVITGEPKKDGTVTLRFPLPALTIRSFRFEALPDEKNGGKVGRDKDGRFAVKPAFAIEGAPAALKIAWGQADILRPKEFTNEGDTEPRLEEEWHSGPDRLEFPLDAATRPQHAVYLLAEPLPAADGRVLVVTLKTADLGRARFSVTPFGGAIPGYKHAHRPELAKAITAILTGRPADSSIREITAAFIHATTPEEKLPAGYASLRDAILECRAGYTHSMVAETLPADKIASVRLLPRGDWMNPGEEVQPAFPGFLTSTPAPSGKRLTRLDLADWLMSAENPLPSRQFTNRLWQQFFGRGLSGVLDDLGSQGEMPSHPELLDWLASEFRESGWDVKHMVRLIVTSQTYQREAATRQDLLDKDPDNRLVAGQRARRLDAEFIRDNALAISGLLRKDSVGGPSVRPYQPESYYENLMFPDRDYLASSGSDQHRRGLYMHWQRTFLHPMLAAFDAPSRETCTAERFQANSPQQALALLNDPSFVEAARAFAQRIASELPDADDETRIRHALKLALSREARAGEADSLKNFLTKQRELYQNKPEDAKKLIAIGQSGIKDATNPTELAAWTQVCRAILNLHESITRY
jgi:hypothetical protein